MVREKLLNLEGPYKELDSTERDVHRKKLAIVINRAGRKTFKSPFKRNTPNGTPYKAEKKLNNLTLRCVCCAINY